MKRFLKRIRVISIEGGDFCYFDYLIFIAMKENFNQDFYIFTKEEILSNKVHCNISGSYLTQKKCSRNNERFRNKL